MDKKLELEAKELLYSSVVDQLQKTLDEEKINLCKTYFFESIDVELMEDEDERRVLFFWKDKPGKRISFKNIKINIFKLLKGIAELYFECQILNGFNYVCIIVNVVKMLLEACMLYLTEEETIIIVAIYQGVSTGEQITDSNLCDKVNLYMEDYMGMGMQPKRIYKDIDSLCKKGIIDIEDGRFKIVDCTIMLV